MTTDKAWMQSALALATRGAGRTWPNPAVGCIIVKGGRVIGRGTTAPSGRPHAEVVALRMAGSNANGATAYVTLEPCAHHGETPPCAEALAKAGVARVVAALQDPDPRVAGGGFAHLQAAGIKVTTGIEAEAASRHHKGFLTRVQSGRPALTLKLAASLDGRIATRTGESQWITGPDARHFVHELRSRHDAVLAGSATARADDPALTVRGRGQVASPVRLVIDSKLTLSPTSKLAKTAEDTPVWVLTDQNRIGTEPAKRLQDCGVDLVPVPTHEDHLDLTAALQSLGDRGLTQIFCEGGGGLAAALIKAGLVDDLIVMSAGLVLGGDGHPALGAIGLDDLSTAPRFTRRGMRALGADVATFWERSAPG